MARAGYCKHNIQIQDGVGCTICQWEAEQEKRAKEVEEAYFEHRVVEILKKHGLIKGEHYSSEWKLP